ncbi:MAG: winged helix-turn-helix domain-containing protein [Desulfocapsaceae bacterium]|nr:winged helix-turn-helix domain-containing protein [Desulfocapsaceae bacterium]
MKALTIAEPETMAHALQDEIRRSNEARYDHRLHAVLLVAQGVKCPEVGKLLGDSTRIVQYWVNQFERDGFAGLADADHPGRPPRLGEQHMETIGKALRKTPADFGLSTNMWDGKTLSAFIKVQFNIDLGVRQSQRLFRQLGFRLRKPRPIIAKADPEKQAEHKKNFNEL